jgi:Spy/CpxP family protein refolding chaperone
MILRRLCALAAVLALVVGFASTASAQRGQGGGRGGFGMMGGGGTAGLVMMKPVQEELKLTADQTTAVTKIAEDAMEAARESFGGLRDASPEDRRAAMEKLGKQAAENDKKIAAALKPEQAARL